MSLKISYSGRESLSPKFFESSFAKEKFEVFKKTIKDENIGFFRVSESSHLIQDCYKTYDKFKNKKTFVHVGIGGSSLGPEMLISALQKNDHQFIFINNIDPQEINDQLNKLDIEQTLFYFCSKSGGTAETMAGLAIISQLLKQKNIAENQFKNYFVFATDPLKSQLLEIGKELQIECLTIPSNIGGRFTVLTPIGFFPALFAGLEIEKLNEGANKIKIDILNEDLDSNILIQTASFLYALKQEKSISQTIFMPYSSKLRDLSHWYVQLWAESLGKKQKLDGSIVNTGFTPIPAYGATDQHSQLQLFMEGPFDKTMILIEIDKFGHDFSLKNNFTQPTLQKISRYSLSQLFKAELNGTLKALEENNRPYIHMKISELNELSMGSMILFFECLTALMGSYLEINPFDQPGVELGKVYALKWLEAEY